MKTTHTFLLAAILAVPAALRAAPNGWIPDIGGGVDAADSHYRADQAPHAACEEPQLDAGASASCSGTLSWDAKACKHVCSAEGKKGKKYKSKKKKATPKKKKKKAKKQKDDGNGAYEGDDDVDFSCGKAPAVTQSAKSSCPGNLVWNEKACKHVCEAPKVDCSGLSAKKCRARTKKENKKFKNLLRKSNPQRQASKPRKALKTSKAGFGGLRGGK